MCACVMITAFTAAALNDGGCQFRSRNSRRPWNRPQSISTRARSVSTRYFEPVTVPAAPQNESVDMNLESNEAKVWCLQLAAYCFLLTAYPPAMYGRDCTI